MQLLIRLLNTKKAEGYASCFTLEGISKDHVRMQSSTRTRTADHKETAVMIDDLPLLLCHIKYLSRFVVICHDQLDEVGGQRDEFGQGQELMQFEKVVVREL